MWEMAGWNEGSSLLTLGKGGHQGGQPPYLDQMLPDGSYARTDECCFPGSPNFTNFTNRKSDCVLDLLACSRADQNSS